MSRPSDDLAAHSVAAAPPGAPDAEYVLAPESAEAAAAILRIASENRLRVLLWGGGSHQGVGHPVASPDIVLSSANLAGVIDWQPDDLTLVVGAGTRVADVEAMLGERRQSAVLPEHPGEATIGGVVAAGLSGYRRLRYGPTRDRMLEVVLATGDGRVVTGGGRLVKNVTGYDLPRLVTGSLGSLGLITAVCLKLWPRPGHEATVAVADPAVALRIAYRPLAVLETEAGAWVYFGGTAAEIASQAAALGAEATAGLVWPAPLDEPWQLALRVPPPRTSEAVERAQAALGAVRFRAAHGVGEVAIGCERMDAAAVRDLRGWAEGTGGALVVTAGPHVGVVDPWGSPHSSVPLQRRVKDAFDPVGVVNPGRLPGGL